MQNSSLQDFAAYLQSKNLAASSQKAYQRHVSLFLKWYINKQGEGYEQGSDALNCSKSDILKYLEYLRSKQKQQNITRKNALIAINHYFTYLHKCDEIKSIPTLLLKIRGTKRRSLYKLFAPDELVSIYDTYYLLYVQNFEACKMPQNSREHSLLARQRNHAILGLLIYQGLSTNELNAITIQDIDLLKATINIKATLKGEARRLSLQAAQLGALLHYMHNVRPKFFECCAATDKLFIALPECGKRNTTSEQTAHILKPLTKQIKAINKAFLNFKQVRASVITQWLIIEGLRKTQYLAGHKYISSTEAYLPNDLKGLSDDIAKFSPF